MFSRFVNPLNLNLNCTQCGKKGRPFTEDGISVGCGHCGNAWDGMAESNEREIYDAIKGQ